LKSPTATNESSLEAVPLTQIVRSLAALLFATVIALSGCASTAPQVQRVCFHQNETIENGIGYCQALRVGDTLYISGVTGQGEMTVAVRSVYGRLKQTLEANGLSFADVVKENVFAKDLDAFIQSKEIRKEFYGRSFPSATWVQVQRLYLPSFVIEVELIAEYPK
jgi:enamine deaminase RidA (YjgF/YER057c/UK114 family)